MKSAFLLIWSFLVVIEASKLMNILHHLQGSKNFGRASQSSSNLISALMDILRHRLKNQEILENDREEETRQSQEVMPKYRLPGDISPIHYEIKILTHIQPGENMDFYFEGRVKMTFRVIYDTQNITIHSKNLKLSHRTAAVVDRQTKEKIDIQKISEENDLLVITCSGILIAGRDYHLFLQYKANGGKRETGFFQAAKNLFVTQFGPIHAREAFPCMDEPDKKATFQLTIQCDKRFWAISNMELEEGFPTTILQSGSSESRVRIFNFRSSVKMSTYVLAFALTDYAFEEASTISNVTVRVWSPDDGKNTSKNALDMAVKSLEFYEKILETPYPLSKLDILPLPLSFMSSNMGMENWGLITFNDKYFGKPNFCWVMAHEVVHMWFGNLVTIKWWDDLWLTEGIASYFHEMGCSDHGQMVPDSAKVSWHDQLNSMGRQPLTINLAGDKEVLKQFTKDQYVKGAAIVNMLRVSVGYENFFTGIKRYLKKYEYRNAGSKQFLDSIDPLLNEFVDSWTKQSGHPILNVERLYTMRRAELTQRPFPKQSMIHSRSWHIPFTMEGEVEIITGRRKNNIYWLRPNQIKIIGDLPDQDKWIIVDADVDGFYNVNYDLRNWNLLVRQFLKNHTVFPLHTRLRIMQDLFQLSLNGVVPPSLCLKFMQYMKFENELKAWQKGMHFLSKINRKLFSTPYLCHFHSMMRYLVDERIKRKSSDALNKYEKQVACLGKHVICYKETSFTEDAGAYLKQNNFTLVTKD